MSVPMVLSTLLLQASAAAPPPAMPPPTPVSATTAGSTDADASDPMVCRRIDVSGSPFAKKECHRMSAWNRMSKASAF